VLRLLATFSTVILDVDTNAQPQPLTVDPESIALVDDNEEHLVVERGDRFL
jgi:hypothetical protein